MVKNISTINIEGRGIPGLSMFNTSVTHGISKKECQPIWSSRLASYTSEALYYIEINTSKATSHNHILPLILKKNINLYRSILTTTYN